MTDTVLRPAHYIQGSHECIDEIKAMLTPCEFQGFIKGNIIKYRYRANLKNGKEDLAKADNYAYYLINGHFKDKDMKPETKEDKHDSITDNSNDDPVSDVFGHIVDEPEKLLSELEKLSQILEHPKLTDTYKGQKITNDKDLMSFNLLINLKKIQPIAELVALLHRLEDIDKNTPVTLRCIYDHMTTGSARTIDEDNNAFDKFVIVFRDKSKLHLKVPRGYDFSDVFKPHNICAWQNVYVDKD